MIVIATEQQSVIRSNSLSSFSTYLVYPLVGKVPRLYPGYMLLSRLQQRQVAGEVDIDAALTSDEESALGICRGDLHRLRPSSE